LAAAAHAAAASDPAAGNAPWVMWGRRLLGLQASVEPAGPNSSTDSSVYPSPTSDMYVRMSQGLQLARADGSQVPRKAVEAFVYYMILLQGRLAFRG
jgi:hypothetical protein